MSAKALISLMKHLSYAAIRFSHLDSVSCVPFRGALSRAINAKRGALSQGRPASCFNFPLEITQL